MNDLLPRLAARPGSATYPLSDGAAQAQRPATQATPRFAESVREPLLQASGITKRFGNRAVLRGINLELGPGERVALFGPNGAGKTTLLRILATLSTPTSGTLAIGGLDLSREREEARRHIGVVAHQTYLYEDLTAEENLRFYARMYDVADPPRRISEVLKVVGLDERRHDRVRTFSRGMQQRLSLARATLHRPQLLLLDEPDAGLDRAAVGLLAELIARQAADGGAVLLTTHDLGFGLASSERVLLLRSGRITVDVSADEIDVERIDRHLGYRQ